ncbi:MAG: mycofactocin-coupled SDR family oxidoreductase [Sporichthyaceae bacterium]
MGRVAGKVAFITGAARGQGRAHAVRLAEEGADIVAVDICGPIDTAPYDLATPDDLAQTGKLVEELDRRVMTRQVDTRDLAGLRATVADAVAEFGGIDIVVANAGMFSFGRSWELTEDQFTELLDVNLTGVWRTTTAAIPAMIEAGRGGSIILISSLAGLVAYPNLSHYVAAKHGVTGLMRNLAIELGSYGIRVNSVHPTTVDTDMIQNKATYELFLPDIPNATRDDAAARMVGMHVLEVPWVECQDIANAVLFLASDESRRITGTTQVIDAGSGHPFKIPHR